jgi:ADP-heptose:LPS heptosyltransferase
MRRVDYFAGVPLCFLLTWLARLAGIFTKGQRPIPARVLFMELSEMGSAILADPAMRKIRAQRHAELYFVIFRNNAPSLSLLGTVPHGHVFTIRQDGLIPLTTDTLRFLFWTRRNRIDTVIDLELFSRYTALLAGLSGASNRVGFYGFHNEGLYRGDMLTHRVAYNPHLHIAKNFVALVNAVLAEHEERPYSKTLIGDEEIQLARADISPDAIRSMRARVRADFPGFDEKRHRIVIVNPNASNLLPQRRWMPEYYAAVIGELLDGDQDLLVLITGAPDERAEADQLNARVGKDRCINFAGRQGLEELPALYQIAAVMLTNDSGPGHFSAVTDLRTFVIFGPETPRLYGSLGNSTPIYAGLACSPCVSASNHRRTPCTDNVCLQAIKPHTVLAQMRAALDEIRSDPG